MIFVNPFAVFPQPTLGARTQPVVIVPRQSTLLNGLLGWWNLNGNSADSLGSYNGTDTNVSYSPAYGILNQGAAFNGYSSKISLGSVPFDGNNWTMAAWLKPTTINQYGRPFSYSYYGPTMWIEGYTGRFAIVNGGSIDYLSSIYLTAGTWQHVVVTRSGTILKIYVNGVKLAQENNFTTVYSSSPDVHLGLANGGFSDPYYGYIDEAGIWNRAIIASEVSELYNAGAAKTYPFLSPPVIAPPNFDSFAVFDGNGDALLVSPSSVLDLTGDFTIEFWLNRSASTLTMLLNKGGGLNIAWASYEFIMDTNGDIRFASSVDNNGYQIGGESGGIVIGQAQIGQWCHVAVTRQGNTYRGFFNGTLGWTQTYSGSPYTNTRELVVGANFNYNWNDGTPDNSLNGFMDDVRITKGVARYTTNFTPPVRNLILANDPYASNVSLLLNMSGTDGSTSFVDAGNVGLTVTANGNSYISSSIANPITLNTNLVGYWSFDNSYSDSVAPSRTYYNNGVNFTSPAKINAGIIGNGSNYLGVDGTDLDITGELTISFWMSYPSSGDNYRFIICRTLSNGAINSAYELRVNPGKTMEICQPGGSIVISTSVTLDAFSHYVFTRDASNLYKLYKDGVLVSSNYGGAGVSAAAEKTYFGTRADLYSSFQNGMVLDEVGIWSRAISGTEVTDLYNAGSGKTYPF